MSLWFLVRKIFYNYLSGCWISCRCLHEYFINDVYRKNSVNIKYKCIINSAMKGKSKKDRFNN